MDAQAVAKSEQETEENRRHILIEKSFRVRTIRVEL
jgi:hypothetical protein